MKTRTSRHLTAILAFVLLIAGGGFLWLGLRGFPGVPAGSQVARTATQQPTVTEPVLPPRPTAAPLPTHTPSMAQTSPGKTAGPPGEEQPAITASLSPVKPAEAASTPGAVAAVTDSRLATPTVEASPTMSAATASPSPAYPPSERLGVGVAASPVTQDLAARLGFGWYLDWSAGSGQYRSAEVEYVPMIRLRDGKSVPEGQALLEAIDAQPGALWIIGNEPDVTWQDNATAGDYARLYHELYAQLKRRDPTCQIAIGGVSQPTPLRLRYLDRILDAYQERYGEAMPVDVWNVHNFILREESGSWGVDIPPGMPEQAGRLREIADHDDVAIFRQQIVDFRQWMKERGQQDKPLIVSEYGILMPADYGFPPEEVEQFMLATFDYFASAVDPELGYPADGFRLVQRWCWFSLADERYPTGNLIDGSSGALTPLGEAFQAWAMASR